MNLSSFLIWNGILDPPFLDPMWFGARRDTNTSPTIWTRGKGNSTSWSIWCARAYGNIMGSLVAPALALFWWLFHCIFLFVSLGLEKRHKMEEFQKTLEAERAERRQQVHVLHRFTWSLDFLALCANCANDSQCLWRRRWERRRGDVIENHIAFQWVAMQSQQLPAGKLLGRRWG